MTRRNQASNATAARTGHGTRRATGLWWSTGADGPRGPTYPARGAAALYRASQSSFLTIRA